MPGAEGAERERSTEAAGGPLDHDAVRAQLERILASPEFHATDKMRAFLRFVVEETLAGRSHRLKGYTIATQVFGRGKEFDAAQDPIVRIQAGRLRRALERYDLVAGTGDPIVIDIPKGRYVPRFTRRASEPVSATRGVTVADEKLSPGVRGPSVAVLPFENLTGDPEQRIVTVGLTEELVTELTRFQDLAVVSCHLARQPPGMPQDPLELARSVGARFALVGAVRRDAGTVKVSARLTDTADGRQVWADASSHPAEAAMLIATQEQIATSVVGAIASEYGIIAQRLSAESRAKPPAELATYEAMLRYYGHQIEPTPESAAACFTALQYAAEREPEYGPVRSALATLYCQMYTFDVPGFDDALGTALEYARTGVQLDPGSQLAHLILAYASHLADEVASFREEAATALALNPNSAYATGTVGYFHALRGELDRGLPLLERAIAVSPCHPSWFHAGHVIEALLRGDDEDALAETRKYHPFIDFWNDVMVTALLGRLGRRDEAKPHIVRVNERKPTFAGHALELIRRSLKVDPLVEVLVDGLRRAGLVP